MQSIESLIQKGNDYPYDASNEWWSKKELDSPPPPISWTHSAARAIIKKLQENSDIAKSLSIHNVNEAERRQTVNAIADIIFHCEAFKNDFTKKHKSTSQAAREIYGTSIDDAIFKLRENIYSEIGKLLAIQSKGATIPPNIVVKELNIPLTPNF